MTEPTDVVIIGAGGFGRETASLVADMDDFATVGFLDDDESIHGSDVVGVPVIGPIEMASALDASFVVTTGHPRGFATRRAIVERLQLPPERFATLVHPNVVVGLGCEIGRGTVIHAGSILTADVHVGNHVAIMPQVVLTHDDHVGDYVTFGAGALVAGRVIIEDGAYVGSGVRIREDLTVGAGALVGMGSVVVKNIPAGAVWTGVPATQLRPTNP